MISFNKSRYKNIINVFVLALNEVGILAAYDLFEIEIVYIKVNGKDTKCITLYLMDEVLITLDSNIQTIYELILCIEQDEHNTVSTIIDDFIEKLKEK